MFKYPNVIFSLHIELILHTFYIIVCIYTVANFHPYAMTQSLINSSYNVIVTLSLTKQCLMTFRYNFRSYIYE